MFQTLLFHHQGVYELKSYKTVYTRYCDLLQWGKSSRILLCRLNMCGEEN